MVVAQLLRLCGHGEHDDAHYIDRAIEAIAAGTRLPESGRGTFAAAKAWADAARHSDSCGEEAALEVDEAVAMVQREPAPDPYKENWCALASRHLSERFETPDPPAQRMSITYLEAIREAQAKALADDPRVFIYGQDVGAFGGAFKATKNLATEFPGRVLDAPISEDAMVGAAIGAAIEGMRPIIEMQFADFSTPGFNQIINQAATLYWRTHVPCPITIRLPSGGTSGGGPFHSQSMEAIYAHYPGLIVMTPATVEDAYSMLLEAVAIDDPVIFCEHKYLYYHLKAERLPTEAMPVGKARIARAGRDLTIVAYSAMVHEALAAAEEMAGGRDGNRSGGFALHQTAGHGHRRGVGGAHGAVALRGRSVAVGRSDGGSHRARGHRRFWFAGRAAAAAQRQGHADSLSSQSLVGASAHGPQHRAPRRAICCECNMKQIPIIMPQLGESIAEATIVNFLVKPGDEVAADQDVIEVETNKATMNVSSPCGGKVVNI